MRNPPSPSPETKPQTLNPKPYTLNPVALLTGLGLWAGLGFFATLMQDAVERDNLVGSVVTPTP